MRRTKIVCTMGPNENDYELLLKIAKTMDVARFNFSHGNHEEHLARLEMLRRVRKEVGRPIASLLDTKGPEIRTGVLEGGNKITLSEGDEITLTTEGVVGTKEKLSINYGHLHEDVKPGNVILIDDGLIGLEVVSINGQEIHCKVTNGGELGERKGVNVPNVPIQLPSITDKDIEDIRFGIAEEFDFVAASFVRSADAIRQIRALIDEAGSQMKIIAKIESQEGLDNLESIIDEADGIMVARGDLGVEVEARRLPHLQKEIIERCNFHGKLVITATQMLDSMTRNPRPTRAEVTDVANAVNNGTDAVMLSGETANGKYPLEAVETMASIVEYSEQFIDYKQFKTRLVERTVYESIGNAVCAASVTTAHELHAKAIVAPTLTGITASMIAKYRPRTNIFALSPSQVTTRQMMLYWGVTPIWARRAETTDELFESSIEELKSMGHVESGDICIITAGVLNRLQKQHVANSTNIMRVMEVPK